MLINGTTIASFVAQPERVVLIIKTHQVLFGMGAAKRKAQRSVLHSTLVSSIATSKKVKVAMTRLVQIIHNFSADHLLKELDSTRITRSYHLARMCAKSAFANTMIHLAVSKTPMQT